MTRDGIEDDDDDGNGGLLENGSFDFMVLLLVTVLVLLSVSATASALLLFSLNDAAVTDDDSPSVRILLEGADIAFYCISMEIKLSFNNNN